MELTRGHGTGYQPTPLEDIDYWFEHLMDQPTFGDRTFVDVGCGKGVVLERWGELWWPDTYEHPRPLLVGIESDIDLAEYAADHADRLITGDASTFDYASLPQPLLLWLFNPFDSDHMQRLIKQLQRLDTWVIANSVDHVRLLQEHGWMLRSYWHRGGDNNTWFWLARLGSSCRSGCPTQDHDSYKACLRAARFGVAPGETAGGMW